MNGETDEWGYTTVKNKVEIHDPHATMLYLLGVEPKRLTFRFGGRDMRLSNGTSRLFFRRPPFRSALSLLSSSLLPTSVEKETSRCNSRTWRPSWPGKAASPWKAP
jgi:hypothetical protein